MNISKTILKTSLICIIVFSTLPNASNYLVEADSSPVIKVEPLLSFARLGQNFAARIKINEAKNISGIQAELHWNAAILKLVKVNVRLGVENHTGGALYNAMVMSNETHRSSYNIFGISVPTIPSFDGNGDIVILTFNVTDIGSSGLVLENTILSDPVANEIAHNKEDGFYYPIQITATPATVNANEQITVAGILALAQANIPVSILYKEYEESIWNTLSTVNTTVQGSYSFIWTPDKGGKYDLRSTTILAGNTQTSAIITATVNLGETPWLYVGISIIVAIIVIIIGLLVYWKRTKK